MKTDNSDWRTKSCVLPRGKGAARETEKYGDSLLCVRYRYDENSRRRIKTVELIIEEKTLPPKVDHLESPSINAKRYACRDFKNHPKSLSTCVNCGWPKTSHKQFKK